VSVTAHGQPGSRATVDVAQCAGVSRVFGTGDTAVTAVRDATCRVRAAIRVALTGPSGSGKSTLLHLLAGLERPTTGSVSWPALQSDSHGRPGGVGVIFQGPSLIDGLDVAENVALPLIFAGIGAERAAGQAREALKEAGIAELVNKMPGELSGGQMQRTAVARVLASRPALILADEPTGRLDHRSGDQVITALLSAADAVNAAVIVATHDPAVAARLPVQWTMHDGALTTDPADWLAHGAEPGGFSP
jgi:ABC-type lipoprotein export system ATPase subunit